MPRFRLEYLLELLIASLATASCWPQAVHAQAGETAFKVTDPTGSGVAGARIQIVAADGPELLKETDQSGSATLHLRAGCSAAFASAPGFKRSAVYIETPRPGRDAVVIVLHIGDAGAGYSYVHDLLVRMPHEDAWITPTDLQRMHKVNVTVADPVTNTRDSYSGVRASELLTRLQASLPKEQVVNPSRLVASGIEYVNFTLGQTDSALEEILVADSVNGHPIDRFFPFRLIITRMNCPPLVIHNFDRAEFGGSGR